MGAHMPTGAGHHNAKAVGGRVRPRHPGADQVWDLSVHQAHPRTHAHHWPNEWDAPLVLLDTNNRIFAPYLAAIDRILVQVMHCLVTKQPRDESDSAPLRQPVFRQHTCPLTPIIVEMRIL
jgi:hypothetical protein